MNYAYRTCRQCGSSFIPRDEGAMASGFCGDSCAYERQVPHRDYQPEPAPVAKPKKTIPTIGDAR